MRVIQGYTKVQPDGLRRPFNISGPGPLHFALRACGPQHLSRTIKYSAADIVIDVVELRQSGLNVGLEGVVLVQVKPNRVKARQVKSIAFPCNPRC